MSENDDEINEEKQIKIEEEKDINEDNVLYKDRPSRISKNSDAFYQHNNRFTTIDNNFGNPDDDSEDNSRRPSNISKTVLTNSNMNKDSLNKNMNINSIRNSKVDTNKKNIQKIKLALKIILVGDSAVGKTSILSRYIDNLFDENTKCTINIGIKTKLIDIDENTSVKMNIWDTAGQERYRSMTKQYYNNCQGAIFVFDLTKKKTFESLPQWIKELNENDTSGKNNKIECLILGNKSDLTNEREVIAEDIQNFVKNKYLYYEVSAKNGNNISLAFDDLRTKILEQLVQTNDESGITYYNMNLKDPENLEILKKTENSYKCC